MLVLNKGLSMQLPKDFEEYTSALMGGNLYEELKRGLQSDSPVSLRINPFKVADASRQSVLSSFGEGVDVSEVPWCKDGFYLSARPNFTFDPMFHAGAYYVQEASSMFLDFILRQLVKEPVAMLDLCASPGGKTTCARAALPEGSILYANEPVRLRANILAENVMKFGHPGIVVTNNYARDYQKSGLMFDVVLTDVPCSGEGMFRKDDNAVREWSMGNVESCRKLQRSIVADIWQCLKPGGLLVYSTCTFNAKEDEENVEWIVRELGADPVTLDGVKEEWNITGALEGGLPVCRFIPGRTKGEGLFMAVVRKHGSYETSNLNPQPSTLNPQTSNLKVLSHGINPPTLKGKKEIPDVSLALTIEQDKNGFPSAVVDRQTAISYLRREAIVLPPDTPRGIVTIKYNGLGLGFANNLGNRANNLYPQEWRIKSTYIPEK